MVAPLLVVGAAGLAAGGLYLATKKDEPPEVQSSKHLAADGKTPVQVIVPTDAPMPKPSVTQVPIAGQNTTVIATSGVGRRYVPPAAVKSLQTPGRLDLLPTVITPSGASSLAVMTVADVQNALNTLGFGPLDVDGKVGTKTGQAIYLFQKKNGLTPDGVAGKNTMQQLQHALANLAAPPQQAAIGAHPAVTSATSGTPAKVAAASNAAIGIASLAGANAKTQRDMATAGSIASNVASLFSWDPPAHYQGGRLPLHHMAGQGRTAGYPGMVGPQGLAAQAGMLPGQQGLAGQAGQTGTANQLRNPSRLSPGEFLQPQLDQRDHSIGRGKVRLTFQTDGNLVLYGPGKQPIWASGTNRSGISRLSMDLNGNLAIYDNSNNTVWTANTAGNPGAYLEVTSKDAVIKSPQGQVLWSAARQGQQLPQNPATQQLGFQQRAAMRGEERLGVTTVVRPVQSVREVQQSLNFLGASPQLLVDGRLGQKTAAAIKVFQITHGMLADGFAGPKTLTAMTLAVADNQRPFAQDSDFGLTLFTLFGGDEIPGADRMAHFGRAAGRRPAPPTGQTIGGKFIPAGGRRRHHHHQQQPDPSAGGSSGGGDSGGGGGGDSGGGGGGGPSDASAAMDDGGGSDDGSDDVGFG